MSLINTVFFYSKHRIYDSQREFQSLEKYRSDARNAWDRSKLSGRLMRWGWSVVLIAKQFFADIILQFRKGFCFQNMFVVSSRIRSTVTIIFSVLTVREDCGCWRVYFHSDCYSLVSRAPKLHQCVINCKLWWNERKLSEGLELSTGRVHNSYTNNNIRKEWIQSTINSRKLFISMSFLFAKQLHFSHWKRFSLKRRR